MLSNGEVYASLAEQERKRISERLKAAAAIQKRRGQKFGLQLRSKTERRRIKAFIRMAAQAMDPSVGNASLGAKAQNDAFRVAGARGMPRLALWFVLVMVVNSTASSAQTMVTPDNVIAEPYFDMGTDRRITCGMRWVNSVVAGKQVKAYEIRILAVAYPKESIALTFVEGSLLTIQWPSGGAQSSNRTAPADIVLFIEGDPETYKLMPQPELLKPGYYSGVVNEKSPALGLALWNKKPITVNYVFDAPPSSRQTLVFRLTSSLSDSQQSALTDCFTRRAARMKASDKTSK